MIYQPDEIREIRLALGAVIRLERERNGLDQMHLAQRLGIGPSAVSRIESGQRAVTYDEIMALSRVFNVLPGYWFVRVTGLVANASR